MRASAGGQASIESVGQAELVPEAEAPAPISSAAQAPSGLAALPSTVATSQVRGWQTSCSERFVSPNYDYGAC